MGELVHRFAGFSYSARGGLQREGKRIHLGPQARQLLEMLLESDGGVISKSDIATRLWPDRPASDDSIDRCAYLLRKPLRAAGGGDLIATAYGRGLSLRARVESRDIDEEPSHSAPMTRDARILDLWQTAYELAGNRTRDGFARAHDAIAAAIALDPSTPAVWTLSADISAGRAIRGFLPPAEAARMIEHASEQALRLEPDCPPARAVLGWSRGILGGALTEGLRHLDHAVSNDPLYGKARFYRSWLYARRGDVALALADIEQGLSASPMDVALLSARAWLALCAGDLARAEALAQQGLAARPDAATLLLILSAAHTMRDAHEEAIAAARRAVAVSPDDPFHLSVLAYAHARGADKGEAERVLAALCEGRGLHPPPSLLAAVHLALGREEDAREALRRGHAEGCPWFAFAGVDPRIATLHEHVASLRAGAPAPG